jgi:hypothetical protein
VIAALAGAALAACQSSGGPSSGGSSGSSGSPPGGSSPPAPAPFSARPVGELQPGSGQGHVDTSVYRANIRFPLQSAPAYANSQVWRYGGEEHRLRAGANLDFNGAALGPVEAAHAARPQCDSRNYKYPWQDNFCETRGVDNKFCANDLGHQGQDIRGAECKNSVNVVVAAEAGTVTHKEPHYIKIETADQKYFYVYLHMKPVLVNLGDTVQRGQPLGRISDVTRDGSPTLWHLHFQIQPNVAGRPNVNPYSTLKEAYGRLLAGAP